MKRILIKISGEALSGSKGTGYDFDFVTSVCENVKKCLDLGAEAGIVIGGGNFWRGVKDGAGKIERVNADRMGPVICFHSEVSQLARGFHHLGQIGPVTDGKARRIIAAVLELPQSLEQNGGGLLPARESYNSAHTVRPRSPSS